MGEKARIEFCGANFLNCSIFNCSAITSYIRNEEKPEKTREFEGSVFKALNKNHFIQARKSLSRWDKDDVGKRVRLTFR